MKDRSGDDDSGCARSQRIGGYRAVISVPGAWRLLASSLLARLPIGTTSLAILLLVREETGSFGLAGLTVGAFSMTNAFVAPVQGRLLDRFGPRRVLPVCAAGQAFFLVALILVTRSGAPDASVVLASGLAGVFVPPISETVRALWPKVVRSSDAVESAYALDTTSQELIWTSGPLIVSGAVALADPATAVLVTVVVLLAGTSLFVTSPPLHAWPRHDDAGLWVGALASSQFRVLLAATVLIGLGLGSVDFGLSSLAIEIDSASAAGLVLATWSIGSMLGGIAYGARTWNSRTEIRLTTMLSLNAIMILPLLLAESLGSAIPLAMLAGIPGASSLSCLYVLVGREAPSGTMAEAFTWCFAALVAGLAVGSAIAGQLVESHGPGHAFALGAAATSLAGLVTLTYSARYRQVAA